MKNSEAILVTPKHFEIQECPVPEPKDHEILMKVEYVGMCGSDIHGFEFDRLFLRKIRIKRSVSDMRWREKLLK